MLWETFFSGSKMERKHCKAIPCKKKRKTLTSELDLTRLFQNKTILTPITLIKPYLNETKQNKKEQTQLNSNRGSRVVFLSMDEWYGTPACYKVINVSLPGFQPVEGVIPFIGSSGRHFERELASERASERGRGVDSAARSPFLSVVRLFLYPEINRCPARLSPPAPDPKRRPIRPVPSRRMLSRSQQLLLAVRTEKIPQSSRREPLPPC